MDFLSDELNQYIESHTQNESELLSRVNRDTHLEVLMPRMLSGQLQGRVLSMISKLTGPKVILEVGTYTGYSALCLAEGLTQDGVLHTLEINEELQDRIQKYFDQSEHREKIKLHIGSGLDIIPTIQEKIDLVFIDADKENYSNYFDLVIDKMGSGGVLIADNVLWSGKVLDPKERENDEETRALHEFNEKVHNDPRVENVLFPIRDGLMVLRKI